MSDGSLANSDNIRAKSDIRKAQVYCCILIAVILLAYFLGGKALIDTARTAQENKKLQLELDETNKRVVAGSEQAALQLRQFGDALEKDKVLRNQNMSEIQPRLSQIEHEIGNLFDVVGGVNDLVQKQKMENAREKADIGDAHELGRQIKESLDQLQVEFQQWELQRQEPLTNQEGFRIATDPKLVERYQVLVSSTQVNQKQLDRYRVRLKEILPVVEEAQNSENPTLAIDQVDLSYLNSIGNPIKQGLNELDSKRRALAQIALDARRNAPSQFDLGQAIENLKNLRADELNNKQVARVKELHEQSMEKRAQFLVDAEKEMNEAAARKQAAEYVLETERIEAATLESRTRSDELARKREEEQLKLDFQRDLPEIKSLLTPFITFGRTQPAYPRNGNVYSMFKGCYDSPVSLTAIRGAQLLDSNDEESIERMYYYGGHMNNRRQNGGFPSYVEVALKRNENVRRTVKRAQELLIKYGELMVDKGLLLE